MEKNIILTADTATENKAFELTELVKGIAGWFSTPVRLLASYYSSILGKKVSVRQTWLLVEVQTAFFAGIFPVDMSIVLRLMFVAWFFLAKSTVRPSKLSTVTFGMSLQHSFSSSTRSSMVNRGSFALLMSTATIR